MNGSYDSRLSFNSIRVGSRNSRGHTFAPNYLQNPVLGKCSGDYCANENLVKSQASEIQQLRKQLNLISRERDGLLCEVHHLRMDILAAELGRLDSSLEVDEADPDPGGSVDSVDMDDEDTLAEDDSAHQPDEDDHALISTDRIDNCVGEENVKLSEAN
ncbi:unnamed protein product [Allacma fusca]|uniref:Uncharacterized protein n=1 Tax=Allacma fusca TaxID=39272 RepID=A0A8J2JGF8_9HEXA|nr:unnamed protein product [Allacma fusca]